MGPVNNDEGLEREADVMGAKALHRVARKDAPVSEAGLIRNSVVQRHLVYRLAWIFVSNNRTPIKWLEMLGDFYIGPPVAPIQHAKLPTAKHWPLQDAVGVGLVYSSFTSE